MIMRIVFLLSVCLFHLSLSSAFASDIKIGARPGYLVNQLEDGRLKSKLSQCLFSQIAEHLFVQTLVPEAAVE